MRKFIMLALANLITACGVVTSECPADADGDGYAGSEFVYYYTLGIKEGACPETQFGDCDDADPDVNPDATEVCDGIDNNCDRIVDSNLDGSLDVDEILYKDADGDGFGDTNVSIRACDEPGYLIIGGDCDDANVEVHPTRVEACDGIDNNCDGEVDEGC